jgi:hypothetical protein
MAMAMASMMGPTPTPAVITPAVIVAPKADLKMEATLRVRSNFQEQKMAVKDSSNFRAV